MGLPQATHPGRSLSTASASASGPAAAPASVGLHTVSPTPDFVRSFHTHAAALREKAPWEALATRHHAFRLGAAHLEAEERVVQLLGSSGRHCGIQIWPSFDTFKAHLLTKPGAHYYPAGLLIVEFRDPREAALWLTPDVALAERCAAPRAAVYDPLQRVFPLLQRGDVERFTPLRLHDARIAEAAMAMAASFFATLVCAKPLPPPPHPICYSFEPCSAALAYLSGQETCECSPKFPAGGLPMRERPWSSYPGLVRELAARPAHVQTIGDAIAFHRQALVTLGPMIRCRVRLVSLTARPELNGVSGVALSFDAQRERYLVLLDSVEEAPIAIRPACLEQISVDGDHATPPATSAEVSASRHWRAHTFGLANALWEMETSKDVTEACKLGERILEDGPDNVVVKFLLDVYLERGEWASVLDLMHRHGAQQLSSSATGTHARRDAVRMRAKAQNDLEAKEMQDTLAWTTALVRLKKHGVDSDRGAKAVQAAIKVNPYVYPLLVRDKPMPDQEDTQSMLERPFPVAYLPGGERCAPEADEAIAIRYMGNFRKHWWVAVAGVSSGDGILQAVRRAGEEIHREECEQLEAMMAAAVLGRTRDRAPHMPPKPPDPVNTICAHCKAVCKVKLCSRCEKVGYCSPDCQKKHWKAHHKKECVAK